MTATPLSLSLPARYARAFHVHRQTDSLVSQWMSYKNSWKLRFVLILVSGP